MGNAEKLFGAKARRLRLTLLPVIVCGGGGSRLWPLSRAEAPKPFVRPPGADESLLAQTYARLKKMPAPPPACVTVAASGDVFLCREVAAAAAPDAPHFFVGEPERRDTAPAVVAAAAWIARLFGEDAAMLVLPADHLVGDPAAFWRAAECAAAAARSGHIALLGVVPESPATGYGYIECGEKDDDGCFAVRRFVEKPNEERAAQFLADGNFLWNAGVFCMTPKTLFAELPRHAPELQASLSSLQKHLPGGDMEKETERVWNPPAEVYKTFPGISFDRALMEKTDRAKVAAVSAAWSDVGSWRSLAKTLPADADGNAVAADAVLSGCRNCFVAGEGRLIAALDVSDVHIIDTPDALLVAAADSSEKVRALFSELQSHGRPEASVGATVRRPWGSWTVLHSSPGCKVKRIEVIPGGMLSLQSHRRRSEHWTTVQGVMGVVIDGREFEMAVDESCHIPLGAKHRMLNRAAVPAAVIEVQIGDYLEEDDIVRYEDIYGRR